jgi:hypothetical protein
MASKIAVGPFPLTGKTNNLGRKASFSVSQRLASLPAI